MGEKKSFYEEEKWKENKERNQGRKVVKNRRKKNLYLYQVIREKSQKNCDAAKVFDFTVKNLCVWPIKYETRKFNHKNTATAMIKYNNYSFC